MKREGRLKKDGGKCEGLFIVTNGRMCLWFLPYLFFWKRENGNIHQTMKKFACS